MARLLDDLRSHPVGRPLHALVAGVCRVQHVSGVQEQGAACQACCWSTCWQEPGIANLVRPVRHAAGLVVDETLAGDEPSNVDLRPEAAASNIQRRCASISAFSLYVRNAILRSGGLSASPPAGQFLEVSVLNKEKLPK